MKFILFFFIFKLLFIPILTIKFFTKIIQTPIYQSTNICNFHHIILLNKMPFINNKIIYNNLYAIDFSPNDDITNYHIIKKLILGNNIKGKVRIFYIDKIDLSTDIKIFFDKQYKLCPIDEIKDVDNDMYNKIKQWNLLFNCYKQNCQHFSYYICNDIKK